MNVDEKDRLKIERQAELLAYLEEDIFFRTLEDDFHRSTKGFRDRITLFWSKLKIDHAIKQHQKKLGVPLIQRYLSYLAASILITLLGVAMT